MNKKLNVETVNLLLPFMGFLGKYYCKEIKKDNIIVLTSMEDEMPGFSLYVDQFLSRDYIRELSKVVHTKLFKLVVA